MAGNDQGGKPQKENRWKRRRISASAPSALASDFTSPFASNGKKASPSISGPSVHPSPDGTMRGHGVGAPRADDLGAPPSIASPVPDYPSMTGSAHGSDRLRSGTSSGGRHER